MIEGETFQHYLILRRANGAVWELGRGAMGVTFKALDTNLHRPVALKVIRTDSLDNEQARQRFVREARAAAGLSHPNVARVFHLGESAQNYFYAMEFIDGETLEACVRRRGPLPLRLALQVALQVANALRAASREGLIHRDIKPSNIMLLREEEDHEDEVHVKVIDFGLAKAVESRAGGSKDAVVSVTRSGFVGTPHYASPEQLDEGDLDVRSDVYSLGVTLWYMLAGQPPFGGSVVQVMNQHLSRKPSYETLGKLPEGVESLLRRMLAKEPKNRPQSAGLLRREIEGLLAGFGPERARRDTVIYREKGSHRAAPPPRRNEQAGKNGWWGMATTLLLIVIFVAIAALAALSAWYVWGPGSEVPTPKQKTPVKMRPGRPPSSSGAVPPGMLHHLTFRDWWGVVLPALTKGSLRSKPHPGPS